MSQVSRYIVFAFDDYYPSGGGYDFYAAYESLESAIEGARYAYAHRYNTAHVFDLEKMEIVYEVG